MPLFRLLRLTHLLPTPHPSGNPEIVELAAKLQWLMFFRVLMISVLLGTTVVFNREEMVRLDDPLPIFFLALTVGIYVLTLIYALILPRTNRLKILAHVQLSGDILLAAALVWGTGGSESIFTFLFSLAVINGAIMLYRPGALITATTSSLIFLGLVFLEHATRRGELDIWSNFSNDFGQERNLYFITYIHLATFYLVAILSSHLAEMLRRASDRLQAQSKDLERFRALNQKIVGSITSGLLTVHQGRVTFCNQAAQEMLGLTAEQLQQRSFAELFPTLDLAADLRDSQRELREPTPAPFSASAGATPELQFQRPDGQTIRLGYRLSRLLKLPEEQGGAGQLMLFEDVTHLRHLEEVMRRSERLASLGQLAAGIAHEVRNPLASISGSVQLLTLGERSSPEERTLLEIMQRETERLERLIANFLGFARPTGRGRQPVDIRELCLVTLKMFENDPVMKEGPRLEADFSEELSVFADPDQLKQVLWNLLTNAAQAMHDRRDGSIRVAAHRVAPEAGERGGHWIELCVTDQGEGMSPTVQARIFDPFFTTRAHGTGLGLPTVHRIIDEHGGQLEVESTPGQGTRICVRLRETSPPGWDTEAKL